MKAAKAAWCNYFNDRGVPESAYRLGSVVDLVRLREENGIEVFQGGIDVVTIGFHCQDFSIADKRLGLESTKSHDGESTLS